MSYRIEVSPNVVKEVKALPGHIRAQARKLMRVLGDDPRPTRAKELRDKPKIYRIWLAGLWRVAYEIDDELETVRILRVRRREQIDYESLGRQN